MVRRLKKLVHIQKKAQIEDAKLPNLHARLGNRALDYFGWEFAKGQ
jgi:hypothetical protein